MAQTFAEFDDADARKLIRDLQKKVRATTEGSQEFLAICDAVIFRDIIQHFEAQEGEKGPWAKWSQAYAAHMQRIGKGNNRILQDSGVLRQNFKPKQVRKEGGAFVWFNPTEYARRHDQGFDTTPARPFMFLSDSAMDNLETQVIRWVLED